MILPVSDLAKTDAVRLIPAACYKPPVLRPLVDSDREAALLAEIEGLTSRRLIAEERGLAELDARELVFKAWGANHINAAFAYTRKRGNRFNDESRGAWYAAFDDLTAIAEVGFHKTRELGFIGEYHDETIYQALLAAFVGSFSDLRDVSPVPVGLDPDPAIGYPAGQELARALRTEGSLGLIYPSVRKAGGTCFVAFHPHIVQNVRPAARWKLTWDGSPDYAVSHDVPEQSRSNLPR